MDSALYTQISQALSNMENEMTSTLSPLLNVVGANLDELLEGSPAQQTNNIKILLDSLVDAQYHTRLLLKNWLHQVAWFPKEYKEDELLVLGVETKTSLLEAIRNVLDKLFYAIIELSLHPETMDMFRPILGSLRQSIPNLFKI